MKNHFHIRLISIMLLFFSSSLSLFSQVSENDLKAVLLERFARFVDWPENTNSNDISIPFTMLILDDDDFAHLVSKIYSKQKIKNRNVIVYNESNLDKILKSDLVYFGKNSEKKLEKAISLIKNKPILSVSNSDGFAQKGVHINLYYTDEKFRFEINEKAVQNSTLKMSYLLLKQAKIVNQEAQK